MLASLELVLWVLTAFLLVPMTVLVAESLAALLPQRKEASGAAGPRRSCVVLIPAHDEETEGLDTVLHNEKGYNL